MKRLLTWIGDDRIIREKMAIALFPFLHGRDPPVILKLIQKLIICFINTPSRIPMFFLACLIIVSLNHDFGLQVSPTFWSAHMYPLKVLSATTVSFQSRIRTDTVYRSVQAMDEMLTGLR